ncbi:hypothetical protein COY27_05065 [Candidatus Woesearchaeota archaeon CG_4_10_14_0_2_um_filter_33_13]|nr:MAG: hypothetical protein COY27_05065 [Candidatus Woesearchaeota archaeon CG_4_10_14_0_2_um_filter_33_13]
MVTLDVCADTAVIASSSKPRRQRFIDFELERVVRQYDGLVRQIAGRIAAKVPPSVEFDDLYQDGRKGLIDAHSKYDPTKNDSFKQYASLRIRGAILDGLRELDPVSRSVRRHNRRLNQIHEALTLEGPVTDERMAEALDMSTTDYHRFQEDVRRGMAQNTIFIDDLDTKDGQHKFEETYRLGLASIEDQALERKVLNDVLSTLGGNPQEERMLFIIGHYYGSAALTFKQIGDLLGVTESRVSQIHSQALGLLNKRYANMLQSSDLQ